MKRLVLFAVIGIPVLVLGNGALRLSNANDADPTTETVPERIAYRDAVHAECLSGSEAAPDELFCDLMANKVNAHFTGMGLTQEILHYGTYGIVPHYFYTPSDAEVASIRLEAERFALSNGADGSTRFTGERVEDFEQALDQANEESDVFLSKRQRCDPEGETMQAIMDLRPGETIEELHRGMDCSGWDE